MKKLLISNNNRKRDKYIEKRVKLFLKTPIENDENIVREKYTEMFFKEYEYTEAYNISRLPFIYLPSDTGFAKYRWLFIVKFIIKPNKSLEIPCNSFQNIIKQIYNEKTYSTIFEPIHSDMIIEYNESRSRRELFRVGNIVLMYYLNILLVSVRLSLLKLFSMGFKIFTLK